MKKLNLVMIPGLFSAGLLLSGALLGHAALSGAVPADGAVLNESTKTLDLTFNEDVRLLKVSVTGKQNQEVDIDFAPSSREARQFAVAIPALEEGSYTVNWTILGSDSHRVENSFSFTVDAAAAPVAGQVDGDHAGHQGNH